MGKIYLVKNTFLHRLWCFALAIQLFNLSMDPRDSISGYIVEDLSFNDIESFSEFFCEEVFGLKNTFKESDDADTDSESAVTSILKGFFIGIPIEGNLSFYIPLRTCFITKNAFVIDLFK